MSVQSNCLIIITPGFPVNENDSTCLPAQQVFIRSIRKLFPDLVIVIVTMFHPPHSNSYQWHGCRVISMHGKRYGKILRLLLWRRTIRQTQEAVASYNVVGILSLWYSDSAVVGHRLSKRLRVPNACWILGQDARRNNPFVKIVKIHGKNLIALSPFLSEEFHRNHGIRPQHLICNSIDPKDFQNIGNEKDIDIIGVGSLIPLKQYEILIQTVASLRDKIPAIKAVLSGKGKEEPQLRKLIVDLNLTAHITLTGELSHSEVLDLMKRSKILLHPSSYEGYSGACLEALGAGCHVVSFTFPENQPVNHWHVVRNSAEMEKRCGEILQDESDFSSTIVHTVNDAVNQLMSLFPI